MASELSRYEATRQLHDIFTPLAEEVVNSARVIGPRQLYEGIKGCNPVEVSNAQLYVDLPWDVFEGIDADDIAWFARGNPFGNAEPIAGNGFIERVEAANARRHPTIYGDVTQSTDYLSHNPSMNRLFLRDAISSNLFYRHERAAADIFDSVRWKQFESSMRQIPEVERPNIARLLRQRDTNIRKWDGYVPSLQRVDRLVYGQKGMASSYLLDQVLLPVGDYGIEYAKELSATTLAMNTHAQSVLLALPNIVTPDNKQLLTTHTARGADNGADQKSTVTTVAEGILSIGQAIAILTCESWKDTMIHMI